MNEGPTHAPRTRKPVARPISRPHERDEREAERAAEVVARGGSVAGWSFSSLPMSAPAPVQRQPTGGPKSDDEKQKEALIKTGEAALETPQGKALKEKVLADPLVKTVKDAITSPGGLVATGAVAAGGVAALAATGKELPFQPPAIPLDKITPGLSAKVTYEGPVNAPTFVGLTISYKEQGPKARGAKKTGSEQYREETARLAAEQEAFRRSVTYAPGSKEAEEQRLADEAIGRWVLRGAGGLPGLTIPLIPAVPQKEEAPIQRAPASADRAPAHAAVDDALAAPGRALDPATRRSMETRFGYDFSAVRVHDDARAAWTAARVDAAAFTVGSDLVFGAGRYDPAGPAGRHLLAHELAHVVQQGRGGAGRIQRQRPTTTTAVPAERRDYEEFVDTAVTYLNSARDFYRAQADAARAGAQPQAAPAARAPAEQAAPAGTATRTQAPATPSAQPVRAAAPAAPGLSPERLRTVLEGLLRTYEGSRQIIDAQLGADVTRADRLRTAYVGAVEAARAAATSTGRVNLLIVAAPKEDNDHFITNATTYAQLYFSTPAAGDTVQMREAIASPDELFDAIETTEPDRMIRRIDIFCHGTIEPTHQIKFGPTWFRVDQIEAAAAARARAGRTLQSQTRFDGSTVIELHACRLGASVSQPGASGMAVTTGEDFLRGFGESLGGSRGQQAVGYEQRWVPRRFEIPGVRSTADVGTSGRRATAFDRMAVQVFDAAMAGGVEVQSQLTDAERAGTPVTRARKVEIMRHLFDAAGGAWLIGHQYSGATPQSTDPVADVPRARDTFSNEADWGHHVLRVTVSPAAAGAP